MVGQRTIGRVLGVANKQVYMWNQRRATNGFPAPVGYVEKARYSGDKAGAPLWNLDEVVDWWVTYDPSNNKGAHWAEKRKAKDA